MTLEATRFKVKREIELDAKRKRLKKKKVIDDWVKTLHLYELMLYLPALILFITSVAIIIGVLVMN